jgi:serine phosphatase RsbU (regulator of sigma subunit)
MSAEDIVTAVCADVSTFVAGAEPSDDLTVLVLRWRGGG